MRLSYLLALVFSTVAAAQPQTPQAPPADLEAVVFAESGTFRFAFAPDKAPRHVEQFIKLARQGYYDGSAFHMMVANGIVQGGDPLLKNPKTPKNLWGTGGLNLLAGEASDLKHERGVVSSVGIPGKAGSEGAQFFVCVSPQPALDGQFTTFGRVVEGMDTIERISLAAPPVRINKITIEPARVEPFRNATPDEMRKTVTLKTTLGVIKIKMEPDWAPNHVRNFLLLTSTGWYNGTAFHRIVKEFVVQGGLANMRYHMADRWVHPLKGEFRADIKHVRGIVSMARASDPDSATTSFFLMLGPAPHLYGQYSAFGRVVEGLEILDAFEKEEVDGETPKRRLELIEAKVD